VLPYIISFLPHIFLVFLSYFSVPRLSCKSYFFYRNFFILFYIFLSLSPFSIFLIFYFCICTSLHSTCTFISVIYHFHFAELYNYLSLSVHLFTYISPFFSFSIALFRSICIYILVGFGRACAPVRCAHPSFWAHCHPKRGAARPPCPSQLRCFSFDPQKYIKSIQLGPPTSKAFFTPLNHMQTAEAPPAHRSSADPSRNILGSKLCTGATIRPTFSGFLFYIFLIFSFCYSLLFIFFLFISFYPSLLISSFSSRRCYMYSSSSYILLFLYCKLFVVLQT